MLSLKSSTKGEGVSFLVKLFLALLTLWFLFFVLFPKIINSGIIGSQITGMNTPEWNLEEGLRFYNERDFSRAIGYFKKVNGDATLERRALLFIGLSYLGKESLDHDEKNIKRAEDAFKELSDRLENTKTKGAISSAILSFNSLKNSFNCFDFGEFGCLRVYGLSETCNSCSAVVG